MLTVVTGAAGFVGRSLAARMVEIGYAGAVRLVDRVEPVSPSREYECVAADLTDRVALTEAIAGANRVIHLAAVPGGAAEADPRASRRVNLEATLDLIDLLAARAVPVRLIYSSTVAVLGGDLPAVVDDSTPLHPAMIYGAHKQMVEIALAHATRQGRIEGIAVRLSGVVARPLGPSGLKSAFISDVFHKLRNGEPYVVPVSPEATTWLVSAAAAADALIHAATMPFEAAWPGAITLPSLRVSMGALVATIARKTGQDASLIGYALDPVIEVLFGQLPFLSTSAADRLGFVHDGDIDTLVARALAVAS